VVSRGVILPDGALQEVEIARAPLGLRVDRGPTNATGTLTGYAQKTFDNPKTRTLQNVRSISTTENTMRLRASIDWFLQPGDTALFGDQSMTVSYINYIGGADAYMDIGDRAL
jgi:hypothetical protein